MVAIDFSLPRCAYKPAAHMFDLLLHLYISIYAPMRARFDPTS